MIIFIELVKRASILHENFFIYKEHFTKQYNTYSPTKQYFTILHNTNSPNKQANNTKQYFRILNNFFIIYQPNTNHTHTIPLT